jgi:hypothetical protein
VSIPALKWPATFAAWWCRGSEADGSGWIGVSSGRAQGGSGKRSLVRTGIGTAGCLGISWFRSPEIKDGDQQANRGGITRLRGTLTATVQDFRMTFFA